MVSDKRFTKISSGIVSDNQTGLQWTTFVIGQKKNESGVFSGDAKAFSWRQLNALLKKLNTEKGYAGYRDWRIPSAKEVQELFTADCNSEVISSDDDSVFWTSTRDSEGMAFSAQKSLVRIQSMPSTEKLAVRLVRLQQSKTADSNNVGIPQVEGTDVISSLKGNVNQAIKQTAVDAEALRDRGVAKFKEAGLDQKLQKARDKVDELAPKGQKILKDKIAQLTEDTEEQSGFLARYDKKTKRILYLYLAMVFLSGFFFIYILQIILYIISLFSDSSQGMSFFGTVFPFFDWEYYKASYYTTLFLTPVILLGSLFAWFRNSNGRAVAKAFNGKELIPGHIKNKKLQKLDLMVEKMAKQANIRKPAVFIIKDSSVNAFAAGKSEDDSIIGVTTGLLQRFDQQEIQAVVAHEFGHIINKDVKISMLAMAAVFGFSSIAVVALAIWMSRNLLSDGSTQARAQLALWFGVLALLVLLVGGIMALCGFLMQKAISRQREFFADAESVKLTGSNKGLISALEKIRDNTYPTAVENKMSLQFSHAFIFGSKIFNLLDTHPPLDERIERLKTEDAQNDL